MVATEVKNLAEQTNEATQQIGRRVEELRTTAASAADAVDRIATTIHLVDQAQSAIVAAVTQQAALTEGMGGDVHDLARDAAAMAEGSTLLGEATQAARLTAGDSQAAANRLSLVAERLQQVVGEFRLR